MNDDNNNNNDNSNSNNNEKKNDIFKIFTNFQHSSPGMSLEQV